MYQAHYINPLIQFGRLELDLILEDDTGTYPPIRNHKSFTLPVVEADLKNAANYDISAFLQDYDGSSQSIIEVSVDLPFGYKLENL